MRFLHEIRNARQRTSIITTDGHTDISSRNEGPPLIHIKLIEVDARKLYNIEYQKWAHGI